MRLRRAVCIVAVFWLNSLCASGLWAMGIHNDSERRLRDLPQVRVSEALGLGDARVDRLVFLDGKRGWFAIETPEPALRREIGFYGTRFLEAFFGGAHFAAGCLEGDTQKLLYAVSDKRIHKSLQYCFASRMDFAALKPFSIPVNLFDDQLNLAQIQALTDQIEADANFRWINMPQFNDAHTHEMVFEDIYIWRTANMPSIGEAERAILADIAEHHPDINERLDIRVQTHSSYTLQDPEDPDVRRHLYVDTASGETRALPPDHALYTMRIAFRGDLEDCAQMLDYFPWSALMPWRQRDVFKGGRAASAQVAPLDPSVESGIVIPRQRDVLFDTMEVIQPRPITHPATWSTPRSAPTP